MSLFTLADEKYKHSGGGICLYLRLMDLVFTPAVINLLHAPDGERSLMETRPLAPISMYDFILNKRQKVYCIAISCPGGYLMSSLADINHLYFTYL